MAMLSKFKVIATSLILVAMTCCNTNTQSDLIGDTTGRVVIAYVTSWSDIMPDPMDMTHINYAFGHVANTFDSVRIDNPNRLKQLVGLKKFNPNLRVILSIGGWGSGNFSEMAADPILRGSFVQSCLRNVEIYGLDGIDIDWEYPTRGQSAGISESPGDTDNLTLLIRDLRDVLGDNSILSIATIANGKYIDFPAVLPYLTFVNIMAYDMSNPPFHHSALYPSPTISPQHSVSGCVEDHLSLGVTKDKLVMGIPMYNRGHREVLDDPNVVIMWDDSAKAPYAVMCDTLALGMENVRSVTHKCQYIIDNGLRGAMYWEYGSERDPERPLVKTVRKLLLN